MDSLEIDYRSGGNTLDQIDDFIGNYNLRPGGGFGNLHEFNLADHTFLSPAGFAYLTSPIKVKPKFTGLPYLGFKYAFGSSLTQDLNVEYQQFFKTNTHLHFQYRRRSSNGFLRSGDYKLNDVSLQFFHQKNRYSTHLEAYYGAHELGENDGLASDSLLDVFELNLIPVKRENAKSKIRKLDIKWNNYLRLIGDSIIGSGLKTRHQYSIRGREFYDQAVDMNSVDTFFIDTTGTTRDQYQTAKISNGAGIYFSSPNFSFDASLNHRYWRNQNLGNNRDTNEVFLHSLLNAGIGEQLRLQNEFYFNLIGATGEIKNYATLNYEVLSNLNVNGNLNFENLYPTPYQRFHQANYYQWNISNLEMQQKLQLSGSVRYGDTNYVEARVNWTNINNGRYFIDGTWRQDTLDFVSVGAFHLKGRFNLGQWSFYPKATIRFNASNFNYQPLFSTLNRIAFTTKLFKAQKLGVSLGVDLGYHTGYQFMTYNGVLDLYEPTSTGIKTPELFQLNAFMALSIDEFRFFVKGENISYLFQESTHRIDRDYPIMPMLIRLGITWDFFN
ncbi:hypothetical protein CW751_08265 [Brumimicrobium salinarum]|uniref:TonB-dependent receptor-like beta-barrel domain-containing protein n=2 Tax=Brumimicrobium salinarum TaxID=2058658 RepID=A0A2I0R2H1_9FLAO|nr:hypothetical protein CW751_08265 [Brumimicrobium salinarum]